MNKLNPETLKHSLPIISFVKQVLEIFWSGGFIMCVTLWDNSVSSNFLYKQTKRNFRGLRK